MNDVWMPIDTAPKDGSAVLVWDGYNQTTAIWCAEFTGWELAVPSDGYIDSNCISPTHWMPLPEPPK